VDEIFGEDDDDICLSANDFQVAIQHLCGGYHDLFVSESEQDETAKFARIPSIKPSQSASPVSIRSNDFRRTKQTNGANTFESPSAITWSSAIGFEGLAYRKVCSYAFHRTFTVAGIACVHSFE
jgi:hypothetical protein